jgi:hypothetical protein
MGDCGLVVLGLSLLFSCGNRRATEICAICLQTEELRKMNGSSEIEWILNGISTEVERKISLQVYESFSSSSLVIPSAFAMSFNMLRLILAVRRILRIVLSVVLA